MKYLEAFSASRGTGTVAALTQLHPFQINWKMLLSGLFPQPPKPHDVLIVHNPTYLRKLGRIIALFGKRYFIAYSSIPNKRTPPN